MIWLVIRVSGCRPPMGRVLAGRVMSTVSAALRAASSACFTLSAAASYSAWTLAFSSLMILPMAGRSSGATERRFFIRAGILPFLLRYSCQKVASVSLEETWPRLSSACFASSSIIACMDVLSFSFVLFSGQQKSSVPCPGLLKGPAKGTKLIKFTAPRYHPVSARLFRKPCGAQNAVTGRTVRPYCRSGRPLGSELQPAPARKPSQPVKLLSLLRCACLLSPSLRLEYSGRGHFDNREPSYHILGRFASTAGRF